MWNENKTVKEREEVKGRDGRMGEYKEDWEKEEV